jgi:hypothetical protein
MRAAVLRHDPCVQALRAALSDCAAILQSDGPPEGTLYLIDGRRVSVKSALDAADAALGMAAS